MVELADILFETSGFRSGCHERRPPARPLLFSGGSPMGSFLYENGLQCLRLTVNTKLFRRPQPNTHYWSSGDMDWWFSAAKQVLDDLHLILTRQSSADTSHLYKASLCGPWRCGPWESDATWLSRFIHHYYEAEGTILHRYRDSVDKHLRNRPDTLRFDIFLLQCWSEMELDPQQRRTFDTIYLINDKTPEICMEATNRYMDRIVPDTQEERLEEPSANDLWTAREAVDLGRWQELQPELAREHWLMFADYARHLSAEFALEIEAVAVFTRSCPRGCLELFISRRRRFLQTRLDSYIDYVVMLAQRDLGIVTTPSLSSGSSTSASLSGPATPTDEMDIDSLLHRH